MSFVSVCPKGIAGFAKGGPGGPNIDWPNLKPDMVVAKAELAQMLAIYIEFEVKRGRSAAVRTR